MKYLVLALCFSVLISGCSDNPDSQGTVTGVVSSVEKVDRLLVQGIYVYLTEHGKLIIQLKSSDLSQENYLKSLIGKRIVVEWTSRIGLAQDFDTIKLVKVENQERIYGYKMESHGYRSYRSRSCYRLGFWWTNWAGGGCCYPHYRSTFLGVNFT